MKKRAFTIENRGQARDFECPHGKVAKLGCVVPYGYIHPRTSQLTVPVHIDWRQEQEETSALLKSGDQCIIT